MTKTIIAFDLYGTLLSTASIATHLSIHFQSQATSIAALWRRYQLEYTWRLNSMNTYSPFSKITQSSLKHALADHDVSLSDSEIGELMHAYDALDMFSDVEPGLKALAEDRDVEAYVFSNGTDDMVRSSVESSPDLGKWKDVFKELVTVEAVRAYKPDPRVYQHLIHQVNAQTHKSTVWLVSGNPFDVVGARAVGLQAAWVDREGKGWTDRLGELASGGPTVVVSGVDEAIRAIKKWVREHPGDEAENKVDARMGPG